MLLGAFWAVSLQSPDVWAHGSVHEQIQALTQEIIKSPGEASLYLRRGELYYHHNKWNLALADYDTAASLDAGLDIVDLYRGKTMLAANMLKDGRNALDRFIAVFPEHPHALLTRARLLTKMQSYAAAVTDYDLFVKLNATPSPEHFLERAQALVRLGTDHIPATLEGLDEGMAVLGQVVTLQLYAIELEVELRRFDAAVTRLEQISAQSARKEKWLFRKGEILKKAGRHEDARKTLDQALTAIESLPIRRRRMKATAALEVRIRAVLSLYDFGQI